MTARVLLVEDDKAIATVVEVALSAEGFAVEAVASLAGRDAALAASTYDVMITDVILPDGNGLKGLSTLDTQANWALPPVIVLSAQNTLDTALKASREKAFEYLPKPFDLDDLVSAVRAAMGSDAQSPVYSDGLAMNFEGPPIVGRSPAMQDVYRTLARVAPTDLSVLVLGESGTGKELVAQAIHQNSPRRKRPFIAVNMAAIPRELIESELFGHEKGAFTGASARTSGRFEQAEGGTLFLDEIGDMPVEAQTRLLRVLQSGEFSPVGSAMARHANVRVVAATNQDLTDLVASGRFREDLYYRLNVIPIALPPLRERASDLGILADVILRQSAASGLPAKTLSPDALQQLGTHNWPGNVRELENAMQRLALLTRGQVIEADDVRSLLGLQDMSAAGHAHGDSADDVLAAAIANWLAGAVACKAREDGALYEALITRVEQQVIEAVLDETGGNQLQAAAALGINRNTLRIKRARAAA
jgi:two-component system, NtrC family, nitrogen regulation response regulator GlnG